MEKFTYGNGNKKRPLEFNNENGDPINAFHPNKKPKYDWTINMSNRIIELTTEIIKLRTVSENNMLRIIDLEKRMTTLEKNISGEISDVDMSPRWSSYIG